MSNKTHLELARRFGARVGTAATLAASAMLLAPAAFAAGGDTIGGRLTAAATDLGDGAGFMLTLAGYVAGALALLLGFWTIWQYSKNPNGQARPAYGILGIVLGGVFLSLSTWATYSSQTMTGSGVTNTGAAQKLEF